MKSDVYFIRIDADNIQQRVHCLKKLLDTVNPFSVYQKNEIIPVKLTVGDSSCIYNINPELVKLVVSAIKENGAKPFLFDTSVIYKGQRQNAIDHLRLIQNKGFAYSKVGAPFIIADGLFGNDGKEFEIDSQNIKKIKIPSFIGMFDNLIVLSHVTGHIFTGYAGAVKNIAMGMVCRSTKQAQHSSLKPKIIEKKCTGCGCCIAICPAGAISFNYDKKAFINQELCIGCGECICACKFDAVLINWHEDPYVFCRKLIDVANFIVSKFKNRFFINFTFDITNECDCISDKHEKIIMPDIGILASHDILSIEKATVDLIIKHQKIHTTSYFNSNKDIYETMLKYASQKGLGNYEYNLINI